MASSAPSLRALAVVGVVLVAATGASAASALPPPLASALPPQLLIDTHVHLSNTSLLTYPWANASLGVPCPAAPPALCNWTLAEYAAATATQPSHKLVFVEVAVNSTQWLAEAEWVQSLADGGAASIGGIVAQPPPGFGSPSAAIAAVAAGLDRIAALRLGRGVRGSAVNFSDAAALPAVIAHTQLLAARNLSFDVITAVGAPGAADGILAVAAAVPGATFILDHIGSPPVLAGDAAMALWAAAMRRLGAQRNIFVKAGGIFQDYKSTQAVPALATVRPIIATALAAFGEDNVVHECNWFFANWMTPARLDMCALWLTYFDAILAGLTPPATRAQRDKVYFGNAVRAYRVEM